MKLPVWFLSFFLMFCLLGCRDRVDPEVEKDLNTPVVPEGLTEKILEQCNCPANGSKLRFATKRELAKINDRIGALRIKTWDGQQRIDSVNAVLIREDHKIGYRIDGPVPILTLNDALVLDEKVGTPDPAKNLK